jgi:hypothetical protein
VKCQQATLRTHSAFGARSQSRQKSLNRVGDSSV